MGLEIVVLLVDVPSLRQLVTTPWCDLYSGLEKRTMRSIRPEQDSRLKVNFDIDAEAELLDWMDTQQRDSSETTSFWSCLQDSGDEAGGPVRKTVRGGRCKAAIRNPNQGPSEKVHMHMYTHILRRSTIYTHGGRRSEVGAPLRAPRSWQPSG